MRCCHVGVYDWRGCKSRAGFYRGAGGGNSMVSNSICLMNVMVNYDIWLLYGMCHKLAFGVLKHLAGKGVHCFFGRKCRWIHNNEEIDLRFDWGNNRIKMHVPDTLESSKLNVVEHWYLKRTVRDSLSTANAENVYADRRTLSTANAENVHTDRHTNAQSVLVMKHVRKKYRIVPSEFKTLHLAILRFTHYWSAFASWLGEWEVYRFDESNKYKCGGGKVVLEEEQIPLDYIKEL
ncbi:hypothetical protein Tco_0723052 [Tanacetum coccineum]